MSVKSHIVPISIGEDINFRLLAGTLYSVAYLESRWLLQYICMRTKTNYVSAIVGS